MADWLDDVVAPRESGGRPNIGWRNTDLTPWLKAGKTVYGFPDWPGLPSGTFDRSGRELPSTAAGLYGITKTNWKNLAPGLGVNDFSPASQRKVADALMATQGRSAWAASEPGYKSGLRRPSGGPAEGYYDSTLHVTLRPNEPEGIPLAILDQILGQHKESEGDKQQLSPMAMLDDLLKPQEAKPETKPPADEFIEPPSPVPAAPNLVDQGPLEPTETKPIKGPAASPALKPTIDRPKEPSALLDSLLNEPIEPLGKGQTLPPLPTPAPAAKEPSALLDGLLSSMMAGGGQVLPGVARGMRRGAEAGVTGQPIERPGEPPVASLAEAAGAVPGVIAGGMLSPLRVGGEALKAAMSGEPVAAHEMLTAGMAGLDPMTRLPGGEPRATPGVMERLWASEQGATPIPGGARLRVAARDPDGKVWIGKPGQIHADLVDNAPNAEMGFADAAGKYLTREEAFAALRPEAQRGLRVQGELDAADYELNAKGAGGAGPPRPPSGPPREPEGGGGKGRFPLLDSPIPGEGLKQTATRIDDALHRVMTNGTADKIEVKRWWNSLPRQFKDPKVRAMMADDIERRMIDPKAKLHPLTQAFLDGPGKILVANENRIVNALRRMLGGDAKYADLPSAAEGYVHRVVETPPGARREEVLGRLDPERARVGDVVTGAMPGRGRSLSKFASSMQARAPRFVLQDEAGNRVFQKYETLGEKGYEYGQVITTPDGDRWTVKPPTMAEMEANTPVRYVHDYVGNLVSNVLRLRRIKRNVELLGDLKAELWEKSLFYPENTQEIVPEHFIPVDLPQMRGHADPKIANVLNDFWNPGDDLSKTLNNINRFLIGTLFITPVPHINNVAAHWMIGRGWDWMSVPAYVRGAKAGAKALNAVWNLTPEYVRMLREGSGLLYGDVAMENFYNQLIQKTWTEQMRNPEVWGAYAKSLGLKGLSDLIKAEYRWSRKTLWAANDMLMLQRQFELEAKGMPTREAIFQTERDIPNYRIPSEVMGSRNLSLALKSPSLFNFGRYHYGLVRSLGEMIKDMIGPKATLAERTEAAGKLTVLGMIGVLGYPALDTLLRQVTGNQDATVKRAGPLGVLSAGGYLARNTYQKFTGETADLRNPMGQQLLPGDKEWVSIVAPLLTPAPTMTMIPEVAWGRDWMGREIVDPRSSPMGMAVQAGEAAASHISPLGMARQSMEEGGTAQALGGLVGLNLPRKTPGPSGRTEKMLRGRARSRERRDPVQNWIEEKMDKLRSSIGGP